MEEKTSCITINCECCGNGNENGNGGNDGSGGRFPGNDYIDITTPYTAESNGYVYASAMSRVSGGKAAYIGIRCSNGMYAHSATSNNDLGLHAHLPVKKGAVVEIELLNSTPVAARFYPAV